METNYKQFRPFDKVLVRNIEGIWLPDFYRCFDVYHHRTIRNSSVEDSQIIAYDGNESLVGTNVDIEYLIIPKEGDWLLMDSKPFTESYSYGTLRKLHKVDKGFIDGEGCKWDFAIRISDFNVADMEATRNKILYVRDGKIEKFDKNINQGNS